MTPPCGTGQHGVLAAKSLGLRQSTVALHEKEAAVSEPRPEPLHVILHDRRQVGIDNRGITATDNLDQRRYLVRHRNVLKSHLPCDGRRAFLVPRIPIPMHENDGYGAEIGAERPRQAVSQVLLIQLLDDLALGTDPLTRFEDFFVRQFREHDVPGEKIRPLLISDAQGITETACNNEQGWLAGALEQRIGRHRAPHAHRGDSPKVKSAGLDHQDAPDSFEGGVFVPVRIFGQQFPAYEATAGSVCNDIGKRATTVDPELPFREVREPAPNG